MAGVLVGCAGSGTSGTGGATGGVTAGAAASALVNIPAGQAGYGHVDFGYLTGQGRALGARIASSSFTAIARRIELTDEVGRVDNPLDGEANLPLANFNFQTKGLNVPFTTQSSRLFTSFQLDFKDFVNDGTVLPTPSSFPINIPARIRAIPGRSTMLPIYVDDAIFTIDPTTGSNVLFDQGLFDASNRPDGKPIKAFINDYVSFDLSGLSATDRPVMADGVTLAGRVYFTGDNYAISDPGNSGTFEALTLNVDEPILGLFGPPGAGTGIAAGHAGTFSLYKPNPTNPDPTVIMDIVALQGTWRDYSTVLSNVSDFEMITFPSSDDNNFQEMVAFTRSGSTITSLYFGYADLAAGAFHIWPVKNIVSADTTDQLDGSITNTVNKNLVATTSYVGTRYGTYTFSTAVPSGFKSTGRFTVFRL